MQAPGAAPQGAPMTSGRSSDPLGEQLFVMPNIKHNVDVMNFNKIFISLVAGIVTGIVGITGFKGFGIYLVAHLLMGGLLVLKAALQPRQYFAAPNALLFSGILSQTELLTFILFWTLSNNIIHLF